MPIAAATPILMSGSVGGPGAANRAADVTAVQGKLGAIRETSMFEGVPLRGVAYTGIGPRGDISRMPTGVCDDITIGWIKDFQSLFMKTPDGVISPGGATHKFMNGWALSPVNAGVNFNTPQLKTAWMILSPLLPPLSKCTSAYRSAADQERIIDNMWSVTYAAELRGKLGARYDTIGAMTGDARYAAMVTELRAIGQQVARPGTSPHQKGKAVDIGGPADAEQVRVAKLVAAANSTLYSGTILKERNGCVHVEIR